MPIRLDRHFCFYGPILAAAIIATAAVTTATGTAVAASKEDNKDDYPGAAASAEETVVSVTHITDLLFQFSISSYALLAVLLLHC